MNTNHSELCNLSSRASRDRSNEPSILIHLDTTLGNVDRVQLLKIGMMTITEQRQDQSAAHQDDTAYQHLPTISIPEKRSSEERPIPKDGAKGFDVDPSEDLTGGRNDSKTQVPHSEPNPASNPHAPHSEPKPASHPLAQ